MIEQFTQNATKTTRKHLKWNWIESVYVCAFDFRFFIFSTRNRKITRLSSTFQKPHKTQNEKKNNKTYFHSDNHYIGHSLTYSLIQLRRARTSRFSVFFFRSFFLSLFRFCVLWLCIYTSALGDFGSRNILVLKNKTTTTTTVTQLNESVHTEIIAGLDRSEKMEVPTQTLGQ